MSEPKAHTLAGPGAVLHYDVRAGSGAGHPVLLLSDPLPGLHMTACGGDQHGFGALRAAASRIILGVGAQSGQQMAGRPAVAVAERLGSTPASFPGGHDGFISNPGAFAAVLRTTLDG